MALNRNISNHDAMCFDGRQRSFRVRYIPRPDRRNSRRKLPDDVCRDRRASCRGRCNQMQDVFLGRYLVEMKRSSCELETKCVVR